MAFLDGNDLCAGCGACCTDVRGLKLSHDEIARLPEFAPLVTGSKGPLSLASWSGPCPYLQPDRRCGVFEQRPTDCGAYPIDIGDIGVRQPDGTVAVSFRYEAGDCPERLEFTSRAVRTDPAPILDWLRSTTGATRIDLVQDPAQRRKTRLLVGLHRLGLAAPLLRALHRLPDRPPPPA